VKRVDFSAESLSQIVIALKVENQLISDELLLGDKIREVFSVEIVEVKHLG
jgi:hypothetical protein